MSLDSMQLVTRKEKIFELKRRVYRDGIKKKRDKIGMGYESLHIMDLINV